MIEEEITLLNLAKKFGIDDLNTPCSIDVSDHGVKVETVLSDGSIGFRLITHFVVKPSVKKHYRLGELKGTSVHRVLFNGEWIALKDHPDALLVEEPIKVVDISVEETENYIANGQINHNTTPGGAAIPYACSTRIRLYGGQQITDSNKEVIGIAVKAKTIKNKVARPFREAEFQIHFGVGVVEDEEAFDVIRRHCDTNGAVPLQEAGKNLLVSLEGVHAWKTFRVTDEGGTVLIEEKWQGKSDFGKRVYRNPKYDTYVTALLDAAMIATGREQHSTYVDVDSDSLEDVRSLIASQ